MGSDRWARRTFRSHLADGWWQFLEPDPESPYPKASSAGQPKFDVWVSTPLEVFNWLLHGLSVGW
jgi:hypothetical protein